MTAGTKEMAVLHVALQPVTGPWSVMRELARAGQASGRFAGVGVGVITYRDWPEVYQKELAALGMPTYRAQTPKSFGTGAFLWQRVKKPPLVKWIRDLAARTGAKRVVVHFHNAWLSGVFLPLRVKGIEVGTVATVHGVNAYFEGQPVRRAIHRWMAGRLARYGARVTSVDGFNLPLMTSVLGMSTTGVEVIPNGVARTEVRGGAWGRAGAEVFRIAYVGGLTDAKGWRTTVAAGVELARRGRRVEVLIAGGGEGEEEAKRLMAAHPGVVNYVGLVSQPRETVMARADVLTLMAVREGLPMVIIEALSVGVPVISTRVGGIPEAIRDGENGMLIERDEAALVSALEKLMDDGPLYRRLAAGAVETFERQFDIAAIVGRYAAVYAGAVAGE